MNFQRRAGKGEEIVISGLSGSYPQSEGVYELRDNLFKKTDLVTENNVRRSNTNLDVPTRGGKLKTIHKFDADFFEIDASEANAIDPMGRILLEKTYEAILDAGLHPHDLRGTKTGVYVGAGSSEHTATWFFDQEKVDGYGITGCSLAMLANRISYWLNLSGPSYYLDSACSSSLSALERAFIDIQNGICDSAIVAGINLCLTPGPTIQFTRLGALSKNGKCYAFDSRGDGYVRSEAVAVIILQKAKTAKRNYANISYVKTNSDGYKPQGITYPSTKIQQKLFTQFYKECLVSPELVSYVETHGTGTVVGDLAEGQSIDKVFCRLRKTPLKIGSVKSNMGHTESAAAVCSITKIIIAFETGLIPPNLHFESPRLDIPGLQEGRMEVVTEATELLGSLIAINSFGFGGTNAHALFEQHPKTKNNYGIPKDDIPRLVVVSGRTSEAVEVILDDINSRPLDAEFVRLLHDVHRMDIKGHEYRGYAILQMGEPRTIVRKIDPVKIEKRSVWFIFNGLGSQWPGMGRSLMSLKAFTEVIKKCHQVLSPVGINVTDIVANSNDNIFKDRLNSIIGITAIQIGFVDIMTTLGIRPDHVIGQLGNKWIAQYATGHLTLEDTIREAYLFGVQAVTEKNLKDSTNKQYPLRPNQENKINLNVNKLALGTVHYEYTVENLQLIVNKAVVVEIGPNDLLRQFVTTVVPSTVTYVSLSRKNLETINVLLKAVGTLYNNGLNPKLANLYPDIEFPVSRGTPMVSPLIRWNHIQNWLVPIEADDENNNLGVETIYIDVKSDKFNYIQGHVIDGTTNNPLLSCNPTVHLWMKVKIPISLSKYSG